MAKLYDNSKYYYIAVISARRKCVLRCFSMFSGFGKTATKWSSFHVTF